MVKNRVPDWLNSSLWSSDDDHPRRHSPKYTPTPIDSEEASIEPPIPEPPPPPPVAKEEAPLSKEESEECRSKEGDMRIPSAEDLARQSQLISELLKKVIDMKELRKLAAQGLTDAAGIRSTAWKLLLGYLPCDRAMWASELAKKRSQYKHFKDELLMNPSEIARRMEKSSFLDSDGTNLESTGSLSRSHITQDEHPLSLGKSSAWNQFFQDTEIIEQIDRDVKRTHPNMEFFSGETTFARNNQEALRRILIIFAKLNPGIRYVQGMNEILAPLYYVFKNDPDEEFSVKIFAEDAMYHCLLKKWLSILQLNLTNEQLFFFPLYAIFLSLCYLPTVVCILNPDASFCRFLIMVQTFAEADTFFCFVELLSGFRDNFCQQLDNSVVGIRSTITKLSQLLKEHDEELWRHLEITSKVNPQFYAFRWITLLLTQEFSFEDSLHIWDTLLSDSEGPQETLLRICCAMLILVRRRLLAGDFTSNLKLLQHFPSSNISHMLYVANKLRTHPSS